MPPASGAQDPWVPNLLGQLDRNGQRAPCPHLTGVSSGAGAGGTGRAAARGAAGARLVGPCGARAAGPGGAAPSMLTGQLAPSLSVHMPQVSPHGARPSRMVTVPPAESLPQ